MSASRTRKPADPRDVDELLGQVLAYVADRRRKGIHPDELVSASVPRALELVPHVAAARERAADRKFMNGGWNVSRCGDDHPLVWCARNGAEEAVDLWSYVVDFPRRCEFPEAVQVRVNRLSLAVELRVAEVLALLAELGSLGS